MRWSISRISSPTTAAGRCMCSMPPRCAAISRCGARRAGETLLALDGKTYTLDDSVCVIADDGRRGIARPASWAAKKPAARKPRPTCSSSRRCGTRSTSPRPAASSASIPTPATASSAASIRPSCCPGSNSRQRWCSISAAARRRDTTVAGAPNPRDRHRFSAVRAQAPGRARRCRCRRCAGVLERLGFFVAGQGERVKVAVPSWRADVRNKADIVEEVVRIVGVDRVPLTPFERGDAPRKPVLTPIQVRTRKAKRALARAQSGRGGHLVVHRQAAGGIVWRRQAGACARQSDRGRAFRHAAEPHSRSCRRRAEERRSRLSRCGLV